MAEEREAPGAEPANVPAEPEPPGSAAAPAASAGFEALLRGDPRRELGGLKALQRSAGNQAVIGLLRAVAPPDLGRPTRPGLAREPAPVAQGASSPLVDRGAAPAPGQMPVDEFLALVERRVKAIAERELAATIYRVAGCPWIDHWLAHYRGRPVAEVERAIRRYAPAAASARTVDDYLDGIAERVTEGIRGWQATGQLPAAATAGGEAAAPGAGAGARAAAASPPVPAAAPGAAVARAPAGRPLEPAAQARMGSAFGADFAGVRVHTEAEGQAVAGREGARAVTAGSDIAFAAGRYAPGTPAGDALLAHELAHVLQQTGGPAVARLEDPLLEADADLAALDAVVDLHLPGGARRAAAARRAGPGLQRCGDSTVEVPAQAPARPYAEIVEELQQLKGRKEAVLAGKEPDTSLPEINARTEAVGVELRRLGVRLETGEIMDRLAADPTTDLMQVRGQMVRMPLGPPHRGDKLEFQAVLDYVPPGRLVEYGWRWRAKTNEYWFGDTRKRSSKDRVDIGSGFWSFQKDEVDQAGGMEVIAYVYLGDEEQPVTTLRSGWLDLRAPHAEGFSLKTSQKVTIVDAPVTIEPAGWAPTVQEHWVDWDVDGKRVADDHFVLSRKFGQPGTHKVVAHLHRRGDTMLRSRGDHVTDAQVEVVVQDPEKAADQMLGQMTGEGAPPSTKQLEATIENSIKDIERHVSEGGEQREFWVERLKHQRKRLEKLREHVPDLSTADVLPADPTGVEPGHAYTGPVKAVLILPSGGGPQVLGIHVRAWQEGDRWHARLVDMTSADVYTREGDGTTALDAYQEAFREWIDDHPYPRGAKVRYQFNPPGWSVPTTFKCRDTAWETVKAWVDGILAVGGVIVGGLLLLTPEPTGATKALGYLFIAAAAARSVIAIYENLELGIDPLDTRNVLEGLSVVTSFLGVSGSLLRQYGVRTVSPLAYRVGNWTVMTSLAGDVGTIAFISQEAIAQLRAIQGDPSKDDGEKNAAFLRVAAQLFASSALVFATNKDLVKQGLKPSDFFKVDPRIGAAGGKPGLTTGSRLDLGLELKKAGDIHTAQRIGAGKIADTELLDRHAALPWLKTGAPADVAEVAKRLSPASLNSVGDASVREVRQALDALADDALFNTLAPHWKSGARMRDVATGMARIEKVLAGEPERIAAMKRAAALEASGGMSGFDQWVAQTASRLPSTGAPSKEQIKGTAELTGELNALEALAAETAPGRQITFTPAPPTVPGTPTPRSFDITITNRGTPAAGPERLVEVETVLGRVDSSIDLHGGVAHAASKLPLDRPTPAKGGPTSATVTAGETLPAASKEAAVVIAQWPPKPGGAKKCEPDGSWELTTGGTTKKGHLATDLARELNGKALDRAGAQYLDRVTIVDGKTGRKLFSLVNKPAPAGGDGSRHLWVVE